MLRWPPEDMEVSATRGVLRSYKSKVSFWWTVGVLLFGSRVPHMEGFESRPLGMDA